MTCRRAEEIGRQKRDGKIHPRFLISENERVPNPELLSVLELGGHATLHLFRRHILNVGGYRPDVAEWVG